MSSAGHCGRHERYRCSEGEDYDLPPFNGDGNYRGGVLKVFFMGQRKGLYRYATVEVCRADEPMVIEYLRPRLQHLMQLWSPLIDPPAAGGEE